MKYATSLRRLNRPNATVGRSEGVQTNHGLGTGFPPRLLRLGQLKAFERERVQRDERITVASDPICGNAGADHTVSAEMRLLAGAPTLAGPSAGS